MPPTNGSTDLAAFRAPIVGEPVLEGAIVLAAVRCPCQQHLTVQSQLIRGEWLSAQVLCPSCETPYAVQGLGLDAVGALHIQIAKGTAALPTAS